MTEIIKTKPPIWFWIVGVVALLWNLMGVGAYIAQATRGDGTMQLTPAWYTAAFAIAVFAGALGCLALLIRKSWATGLFAVSFIAVILQQIYHYVLSDIGKNLPTFDTVMNIMIPIIALLLILLARSSARKGWIT